MEKNFFKARASRVCLFNYIRGRARLLSADSSACKTAQRLLRLKTLPAD